MRRCIVAAAICCAAGAIVLSGCSSSVDGAAQAGTTVAAPGSVAPTGTIVPGSRSTGSGPAVTTPSVSGDSSAESASTTPTGSGEAGTPDAGSGPAPETSLPFGEPPPSQLSAGTSTAGAPAGQPAADGLDTASEQWFTTYCRGMSEIAQYNTLDTSGLALPALIDARVAAYSGISLSASTTVGILQATPPPTFTGGSALAASVVQRFSTFADVYGRGALSLQSAVPPTDAALQAAVGAIEQEAAASIQNSMSTVDSGVLTQAKQLPECQAVLN